MGKDHDTLIRLEGMVEDIHKVIFGNGKPGMYDQFAEVKHNQDHCMKARKSLWVKIEKVITLLIAAAAVAIALSGCQTVSKVEYYDPPQFGPDGQPLMKNEEKRDGIPNWSEKVIVISEQANIKPEIPDLK